MSSDCYMLSSGKTESQSPGLLSSARSTCEEVKTREARAEQWEGVVGSHVSKVKGDAGTTQSLGVPPQKKPRSQEASFPHHCLTAETDPRPSGLEHSESQENLVVGSVDSPLKKGKEADFISL